MECTYHPGVGAIGVCQTCGRPVCPNCQVWVQGRSYCRQCLSMTVPSHPGQGPGGLAITSFVLSLAGFACGITAIPGLIIGLVELGKIRRGESPAPGRGFALAGVIVGGIIIGLGLLYLLFVLVLVAASL